jgi:hypothetical protein
MEFWKKFKDFFTDDGTGINMLDWSKILGTGAGAAGLIALLKNDDVKKFIGLGGANTNQPRGYQGGIPEYTAKRTALPMVDTKLQNSQIRDWATQYGMNPDTQLAEAQKAMSQGTSFDQLMGYAAQNKKPYTPQAAMPSRRPGSGGRRYFSDVTYEPVVKAAQGGLMSLPESRGYYLGGPTDGMADRVPARIDGAQEAALSDGEFVMPADIVSHLGNGNSEAGAKVLYDMMERVRKARTGRPEQGRQINPNKYTPA